MKSDYLKPETYTALYRVMQKDNVLALRVALETGLRIDDVLRIRYKDFNSGARFTYKAKKTGKTGTKTITKALKNELFTRRTGKSVYLFPGRKRGTHRTRQAVWKDVRKAAGEMGVLQHVSPHSARKTYAVELRKEKGLAAVQKELQHSDMTTTMLYAFADMAKKNLSDLSDRTGGTFDLDALAELIARRVVELLLPEIRKSDA